MHLDVGGHPLHSHWLGVTLTARADGRVGARGVVLDLRKRGFVPVGSDLQPAGIVHHMRLDAIVDPAAARLDSITAAQPDVAFEASALTRGESCRDPIDRVAALAGTTLDAGWAKRLAAEVGGPRGCSHLMTLALLFGSTIAWALEQDRARFGTAPARRPDERIFRRDVIVDGHDLRPGALALALQVTDLHYAPAPAIAPSMDRFASEHEIRGVAEVDFGRFALGALTLGQRHRDHATLETAVWHDCSDVAEALVGQSLARGVSQTLLARAAEAPHDRPVFDGLLMLAPALIQCVAALSEAWPAMAAEGAWVIGMGGRPDSCYMWRADGALQRARGEGEPPTA